MARDLISKILVVNPLKRATIADIRNHPWFKVNLPDYLAVPANITFRIGQTIDEDVLNEALQKFDNVSRSDAKKAIMEGKMDDITVVYHLLLDYKMKKTLRGKNNSDKNKWPQIAQSPPVQITLEMVMNRGKFDDRESSMTSPRHFTKEDLTIDTSEQNTSDWWHLGISCTDKTSNEIMKDVYGVLKKMDMVCFFFT